MALILCIETSTNICSVALSKDGRVFASKEEHQANSHAALLTVLIEEMMNKSGCKMDELDAVAVSGGPGSYTGLRIGVSVAKGICYALNKPLLAITSLQVLAKGMLEALPKNMEQAACMLCPMIDARRMEVYTVFFDGNLQQKGDVHAAIIDSDSFQEQLDKGKIIFAGNGAAKCSPVISHRNAVFLAEVFPLAAQMATLAPAAFDASRFENLAYFEPFYLKDFIATIPRRKVL